MEEQYWLSSDDEDSDSEDDLFMELVNSIFGDIGSISSSSSSSSASSLTSNWDSSSDESDPSSVEEFVRLDEEVVGIPWLDDVD